eukprot:393183-Pleurochrysis_carterae.AAC.1
MHTEGVERCQTRPPASCASAPVERPTLEPFVKHTRRSLAIASDYPLLRLLLLSRCCYGNLPW